jgi:crotonobetainyl-CoA:carnitine CoA-transferase CaiB-like acyl-CoA transferase
MADANAKGPLDGVKILDMTEHMAGPFCTMILGDMGAEVIKLERPGAGDSSRGMGDGSERNPYFRYINRNKKSLTLDYKGARGREIFLALIPSVDVLVENYRPTVMDRAGLGWETLSQVNPRLIYAQLSGFGSDGPYREKGGFDLIAQGMGGIMHVTGEPDGPPTSVGLPICDLGTGMWGAQGVLAALYERQRTGRGQKIECSLLETAVGFSSWTSAGWLADHVEPVRMGSRHRQNAPYQRFETQDGYMMIGVLDDAGVPCGPVYNYEQLFSDPQVKHREMVVHADDAELGRVPHIRTPIRMSAAAVAVRRTAPRLGQHVDEILAGLGYSPAQVAELRRERVI